MSREAPRGGSGRELLGLLLLTVAVTLPFVGQAFHIDDPTFLAIAGQLARDPWRPYSFSINWLGSERPAFTVLANPPLVPAYIALVRSLAGEREVALHIAFIPVALGAAWGVWRCAGCFVRHRATAAALFLVTPAFVVSSHTLMPDVALVALMAHAVASTVGGVRTGRSASVATGALLASLAALTRYNGVMLVPLLVWAWWLHRPRNWRHVWWLGLPVAVLALWSLHNVVVYGAPHFLAAASVQALVGGPVRGVAKALASGSYLGGAALFPLVPVAVAVLEPGLRRGLVGGTAVAVPLSVLAWWLYFQPVLTTLAIGVMLAACGVYLGPAIRIGRGVLRGAVRSGDGAAAGPLMLAAWLVGSLLFNLLLLFAAVRYLLPAILPAILLLIRVLEDSPAADRALRWLRLGGLVTLGLSLGLSVGDMELAGAGRLFAATLRSAPGLPTGARWFVGHWGFQYYMERTGARALDTAADSLPAGDLVVLSRYSDPHRIADELWPRLRLLRVVDVSSRWPVRSLSHRVPGFFHGNTARIGPERGPFIFLPYALSTEPLDRFYLYKVDPPLATP